MPTYNKLVRDKIPQVIEEAGQEATFKELDKKDCIKALRDKCGEELNEYLTAKTDDEAVKELADMIEVIYALAEINGTNREKLEYIRIQKAEKRGGFEKRLFLEEVRGKKRRE